LLVQDIHLFSTAGERTQIKGLVSQSVIPNGFGREESAFGAL